MTEELKAAVERLRRWAEMDHADVKSDFRLVLDALKQTQTELSRAKSPSWRAIWQQEAFAEGEKVGYRAGLEVARELLEEGKSLIHDLVVDGWHPGLKDRIDAFLNGGKG